MHELGLAHGFMEVVLKTAREKKLRKITRITVLLGEASGVEKDFLEHSLVDHIMPATIAEGAEIKFIKEPLRIKCGDCGCIFENKDISITGCCPGCKGYNTSIETGLGVRVESIEGE